MSTTSLDKEHDDLEQYWSDRRSSARHKYQIQQVIAVALDANGAPKQQSFIPVQCNDISRGGISFFWPELPNFSEIAFYLIRENECSLLTSEVRHARPVLLDGKPVFLVGCRFKTRLPEVEVNEQLNIARRKLAAHRDSHTALTATAPNGELPPTIKPKRPIPVMLVEEQRNSLRDCVDCLESAFAGDTTLIPFEEPDNAIEYLQHHRVDILVTDLLMKQAAGMELVMALRRRNNYAQCYLLTDIRAPELLMDALEAGVTDFLDKPLNRAAFVHTIRHAIQWQHRWRETLGDGTPQGEKTPSE